MVGESASGEIQSRGDRDWFAVELAAETTYLFALEGSGTDPGTLSEPYLAGIHDSEGNRVDGTSGNNPGEGRNARVSFTAPADGTYYVSAGADRDQQGSYRLTVTRATSSIRVSDTEAHEEDGVLVFSVVLDEASAQPVTVRYATADGTAVVGVDYEPASGELEFARGETEKRVEVTLIDDNVEDNGETFVLRLSNAMGAVLADSEGTGTIHNTESVSEGATDFPADTSTTGRVVVGGSVTGTREKARDRDWFAVELEAGGAYRIDMKGGYTDSGTLRNPYLRGIHDAKGNLITGTTDDRGGLGANSQVTFTPLTDGTYYVSAGAHRLSGVYVYTGTYTLTVEDITDAFTRTRETDNTGVAVGGSVTGSIDHAGDRDWYAVTLEANTIYRILMEGSDTDGGTLGDPFLYGVYDSDNNLIDGTTNDNGESWWGLNSWVFVTPSADGTYYVYAGGYAGGRGSQTGTYTLSVRNASAADVQTAATDTSGSVRVNRSVRGETDYPREQDWYAVELDAGGTYRFDLEGRGSIYDGTLIDPYLYGIFDSAGDLILGTRNNNGGRLDFTPTADGTYYVSAGAAGSRTGTYKLTVKNITVTREETDFPADTNTSGRILVGGSATGLIENADDRDWFAVELTVGTAYRIDMKGRSTSTDSLRDPYLRGIHDAMGNLIPGTTDDDSGVGRDSQMTFTPSTDGTYYVSAGAFGGYTGTYTLTVEEL